MSIKELARKYRAIPADTRESALILAGLIVAGFLVITSPDQNAAFSHIFKALGV